MNWQHKLFLGFRYALPVSAIVVCSFGCGKSGNESNAGRLPTHSRAVHTRVVPELATNAPVDKPVPASMERLAAMERAIAPYIAAARKTYPEAKKRYLAGLPPKHVFFVTTRFHDKSGGLEQGFVAVESIKDGKITGTIASKLEIIKDYKRGQEYTFAEAEILDWLISKPDGSEEGNFVGKFLDTYKP